jgi:hypothetical protein
MYWQFPLLFVYKQERSNHAFSMNESNDEKKSSIRTGSSNQNHPKGQAPKVQTN